jgi:predicted GTPase
MDFDEINTQDQLNSIITFLKSNAKKYHIDNRIDVAATKLNAMVFNIAIVANMSSGKSSFINALFGDSVLPALNEATTDCATYIHSDDNIENDGATVYFSDGREPVKLNVADVKEEIKKYARKDCDDFEDKYRNVEHIELDWDFEVIKNTEDINCKFTIIDTPGPNNTGAFEEKHRNITNMVIREKADLVMFLFDFGQLDANLSSDEQGLWEIIKRRHDADKFFDVFFVINKIDLSLADDLDEEKERGFFKTRALKKLTSVAIEQGLSNPKVICISAMLGALYKMKRKGLLEPGCDEYKAERRSFKKNLIEFEDDQNPETSLLNFSGIEAIENSILTYIKDTIESKLVAKIRYEVEGIVKETENRLNQRILLLSKHSIEAKGNIEKCRNLIIRDIPRIFIQMNKDMNTEKGDFLNACNVLIQMYFLANLKKMVDDLIYKSVYAAFFSLEKNVPWPQAILQADNEERTNEYSLFKSNSSIVKFDTKKTGMQTKDFLDKMIAYSKPKISEALLKILNGYKIELKKLNDKLSAKHRKQYSKAINKLNVEVSETLTGQQNILLFNASNIPTFSLKIPNSCIEKSFSTIEKQVKDGVKEVETTRSDKKLRGWYNPLKYNPFDWDESSFYTETWKEKKLVPVFKTKFEKKYRISIDTNIVKAEINDGLINSVNKWKEADMKTFEDYVNTSIYEYNSLFKLSESTKSEELKTLISEMDEKETNFETAKEDFREFSKGLLASSNLK